MSKDRDAQADEYRWTFSEYLLRCEEGADIKEVIAESDLDRDFYADAFRRWQVEEVVVLDAGYIAIDDEDTDAAGFLRGVKGRMLTLAAGLKARHDEVGVQARVAVVVDRDYDEAPAGLEDFLLLTDGHSLESYAFFTSALDRFVALFLGRQDLPPGAGGTAPSRRATCSGEDLYRRIVPTATRLAAVRLMLSDLVPPLTPFERWIDYVIVESDGMLALEEERLVRNLLDTAGKAAEYQTLSSRVAEQAERVASDAFALIRGHDLVALLLKLLRSPWGRRVTSSTRFALADERSLIRLLLISIDPDRVDSMPLLAELRRRFGAVVGPA